MERFEAVAPARATPNRPARAAMLTVAMVLAAVALVVVSGTGSTAEPVRGRCLLFVHGGTRMIAMRNLNIAVARFRLPGPCPASLRSPRFRSASSEFDACVAPVCRRVAQCCAGAWRSAGGGGAGMPAQGSPGRWRLLVSSCRFPLWICLDFCDGKVSSCCRQYE